MSLLYHFIHQYDTKKVSDFVNEHFEELSQERKKQMKRFLKLVAKGNTTDDVLILHNYIDKPMYIRLFKILRKMIFDLIGDKCYDEALNTHFGIHIDKLDEVKEKIGSQKYIGLCNMLKWQKESFEEIIKCDCFCRMSVQFDKDHEQIEFIILPCWVEKYSVVN